MTEPVSYAQASGQGNRNWEDRDKKWELVQVKAFTSWLNGYLEKRDLKVESVEQDLQDGIKLLIFLEMATGKSLGRWDKNPKMQIQKVQNLNLALNYMQKDLGIKLVGIAAEDFLEGNRKLILGTLWSLFRRLRIQTISEEGKSSEDGLLLWIKKQTQDYQGVNVTSFKDSFNDGLAFSALIHSFNNELLDYDETYKNRNVDKQGNIENAFEIAETHLGIPKLLDVEDLLEGKPDERAVTLYCSLFFHAFVSNEERRKIEAAKSKVTDELSELKAKLQASEDARSELEKEKSELDSAKSSLESELAALRSRLSDEEKARAAAQRQVLALQKELEKLKKSGVGSGSAVVGLELLRRNLVNHLEEFKAWSKLQDLGEDSIDIDALFANTRGKSWGDQLQYLDAQLESTNSNLLRLIKLQDSKHHLDDVVVKDGWLHMKGRTEWKKRWFVLRNDNLYYYETPESDRFEGLVDLSKGCDVLRQKATKNPETGKKVWPLKVTVGERKLFIRAATKKERHSWYLHLVSSVANIGYKESDTDRPDTRVRATFHQDVLASVHVENANVSESSCNALARILPAHDETETLSLANGNVGDQGLTSLASILGKVNITSLDLSGNNLSAAAATSLEAGLRANKTLANIDLSKNKLGDDGAATVSSALSKHGPLASLNLSGNGLGAASGTSLKENLGGSSLSKLTLRDNKLGDAGSAEVAALLSTNGNITHVDLAGNEIGDEGAQALAAVIKDNANLVSINLADNDIGSTGLSAIESALQSNHVVIVCDLSNNPGEGTVAGFKRDRYALARS